MKISIIVPIYNVEKYLERCILSIIKQTYQNIEIILVNDGSTDSSIEICKKYSKLDPRILLIDKENGGLSDARNVGLQVAKGDYVLFVDSDDYIELDSCEKFVGTIKKYDGVDLITSNAKVIYDDKTDFLTHSNLATNEVVNGEKYFTHEIKHKKMSMAAVLNCYRLSFLKENDLYFEKGILHEDEEFTPRVFIKAQSVLHMNTYFYNYVLRDNSISRQKDLSQNATDLFHTLYKLETVYDKECMAENKAILKNSLCEKYLYMAQALHQTKTCHQLQFDKEFVRRNADSNRNKLKALLFSMNISLYFFINDLSKNIINDMKSMLCKKNIFYSFVIILNVLFMSRFFYIYRPEETFLSTGYIWLSRILCVFDVGLYSLHLYKHRGKINGLVLSVLSFLVMIFIINIIDGGSIRSVISSSYPIIGMIMVFEILFKKDSRHIMTVLYYTFSILLFLNIFQMIFLHDLIGENVYLLGYRNQLGVFSLIGLFIAHLYSYYFHKFSFYIMFIMVLIMTVLSGSVNNFISVCLVLGYLLLKKTRFCHFIDRLSSLQYVLSYVVFFISIVHVRIQEMFSFIIEGVFHRSLSLSGRTYLWDAAITGIKEKIVFGHGRGLDTDYFSVDYFNQNGATRFLSAHNTFLQLFYEFGIVPVIFIIGFIFYFISKIKAYKLQEMNLFFVILFSILIIFMMEALPIDGLFFIIAIAYFYCLNYKKGRM